LIDRLYGAHLEEIARRFAAALDATELDAVVVAAGGTATYFLDDIAVPFRPNPYFRQWGPVDPCEDFAVAFRPGERPVLVHVQPDDYWHLPPSDPEGFWVPAFHLERCTSADEATRRLRALGFTGARTAILAPPGALDALDGVRNPPGLLARLDYDRVRKTAYELERHREASRAATRGHVAARAAFLDGASERAIHFAYLQASGHLDAELPYPAIVALDRHAAVLHYQYKDPEPPRPSNTLLIDSGAASAGYAADVTRTWTSDHAPAPFADLVTAVDALQQTLVDEVRPGVPYPDLHGRFHERLAGLLLDAGLVRGGSAEAVLAAGLTRVFCPHGLGHHLGLTTHDAGGLLADRDGRPAPPPATDPALRNTRLLEADQVVTIEPGLYFIEALLADAPYGGDGPHLDRTLVEALAPCGGIRIEDDVAVTPDGVENLTRDAFGAA
jgi:Xaa-Pro dipeptidase